MWVIDEIIGLGELKKMTASNSVGLRMGMVRELFNALSKGNPFTGTAYYLAPNREGWHAAWARWATIVSKVPDFMGISGGPVVEDVDGCATSFLVFVGWESVELHDAYHHTEEFARLKYLLEEPVRGMLIMDMCVFGMRRWGRLRVLGGRRRKRSFRFVPIGS